MPAVKGLRERLRDGEDIICAEGYMMELERRGFVCCGDFTPEVVLDFPERVRALHQEFVWAGSDVVEAYTYYGHREKLKSVGREVDVENLNMTSLKMAREVADATNTLMAGNICNTTSYDPGDPVQIARSEAMFKEQIEWAVKGGADYIIAETFMEYAEAKLALECIQKYGGGLPAVVTIAIYAYDKTFDGMSVPQALSSLEQLGADVVGLNCARGPSTMLPLLREAAKVCKGPLAAIPVPFKTSEKEKSMYNMKDPKTGMSIFPHDLWGFQCSRTDIQEFARQARNLNIRYIGLCCGASPTMLREVARVYGRSPRLSKYAPDTSRNFYMKDNPTERHGRLRDFLFGQMKE